MQITRSVRLVFFALLLMVIPASSVAGVFVSVNIAPPVLPVYVQPACPGDGYIWTPGYWAYGDDGYYWVPGTWVMAPEPGLLWTPGYWGWGSGAYIWHAGYWGPHVGFYGGVNYGFGYVGSGFYGGEWRGGHFFYNRSVSNVNITNVHIYNRTVINEVRVNRVAYNGGPGGINMRPRPEEERAMHERHFEATRMQSDHERGARSNRELLASVNHGRPGIAATARPGQFRGRDVVPARAAGGPYRPENRPVNNDRAMNRNMPRPENPGRFNPGRRDSGRSDSGRPDSGRSDSGRSMERPQTSARNMERPGNGPRAENSGRFNSGRPDSGRSDSGRSMERPQTSGRNMERPGNAPRAENRAPAPRQPSYHQENNRQQPHESAPRPQRQDGGHEHKR